MIRNKFIDYDLQHDYLASYKTLYKFLLKYPEYCSKLKRMPYDEFLDTRYWEVLSAVIKMNIRRCECCGRRYDNYNQLVIHHMDYNIRGHEIFNRKELFCICHSCHKGIHTKRSEWLYYAYLINYVKGINK